MKFIGRFENSSVECLFHVRRKRSGQAKHFSRDRMKEGELMGMESLTGDPLHIRIVQEIADEGIAQKSQVNPDLMGTPGRQRTRRRESPFR